MAPQGIPLLTLGPDGQPIALFPSGESMPLHEGVQYAANRSQGGYRPGLGTIPYIDELGTGAQSPQGGNGAIRSFGGQSEADPLSRTTPQQQRGRDAGYDAGGPVPPPLVGIQSLGDYGGPGGPQPNAGGSGPSHQPPSLGSRLSDARGRLYGARERFRAGTGGGVSGTTSSYSSNYHYPSTRVKEDKPDEVHPLHGPFGHGLDPEQALGFLNAPTGLLPRVFPGLTAGNPVYRQLSEIPAGYMAMLLGKGTPQSLVNKTSHIYLNAGYGNDLPDTGQLWRGLTKGKGLEDMFQGVKAGKKDAESYYNPGYAAGQEPMSMGGARGAFAPFLDAALYNEPWNVRQTYGSAPGSWGSYWMDKWAAKAAKKPAGKGPPIYRYIGRHLFR